MPVAAKSAFATAGAIGGRPGSPTPVGGEVVGGDLRSNGELLDLDWVPIPKALELNIIDVTEFVLQEVASRLDGTVAPGVPLICYRGGSRQIRRE